MSSDKRFHGAVVGIAGKDGRRGVVLSDARNVCRKMVKGQWWKTAFPVVGSGCHVHHFGYADPKQKSSSDILEKSTGTVIYSIVFHDAVMTFYLQDGRVLCNHFNQKSNESLSGRVDTSSPYPFMFLLSAQHDNHLYTVVNPADVGASDNGDALVLLVFS